MKTLKINEIFYSLQGEGHFTGTPAVFLRMSGCNMRCPFCDTQHEEYLEMSEEDIVLAVSKFPARHIVITGGEPTIQLTASLCTKLHQAGFFIQIETNGTLPLSPEAQIDWITCSPKGTDIRLTGINELKVLFPTPHLSLYENIPAQEYRLQPIDTGDSITSQENLQHTINHILQHPKWQLSLQTHKIINIQ